MSLLSVVSVGKHYGAEEILRDVSFQIGRGEKVALVGSNGAGKSTILRIAAGLEEPDAGSVSRARGLRVSYLPQDPAFNPEKTLYDVMLEVFEEVISAQARLQEIERHMAEVANDPYLVQEYGRLQALVEHVGYDYREQIERVLAGLELEPDTWQTQARNLSGGQRTRANLARTLLQDADLLLLDEPTNHLDIGAVEWLETYLRDVQRAFLMVAHDRYLLERVTRRTLELAQRNVVNYDAPYGRFLELRAERLARQRREYEAQQEQIAKTEDFVRRYGAGQRSREAKGRQKRLDRLQRVESVDEQGSVRLRLGSTRRSGDVVLSIDRLAVGYDGTILVHLPPEVVVRRSERVALVGPNGSGKTTILRTLVGALPSISGSFTWGTNTSLGYYSQTLGQLGEQRTVLEEIQLSRPMAEDEARTYLGRYLFFGDDAHKTVSVLSGGERSRVALAKLILEDPNVLVLDEPTNHLDIASRDALQAVLEDFGGTILFVSHDRFLIDTLAEHLWVIENQHVVRYQGTYTDYAAGSARKIDWEVEKPPNERHPALSRNPEERLLQLEQEAVHLAGRLAEMGPTTSLSQLTDLTDQYAQVQHMLEETQSDWLQSITRQLRSSSG